MNKTRGYGTRITLSVSAGDITPCFIVVQMNLVGLILVCSRRWTCNVPVMDELLFVLRPSLCCHFLSEDCIPVFQVIEIIIATPPATEGSFLCDIRGAICVLLPLSTCSLDISCATGFHLVLVQESTLLKNSQQWNMGQSCWFLYPPHNEVSCLCILSSNFRRCVACNVSCKIFKCEFLAIF